MRRFLFSLVLTFVLGCPAPSGSDAGPVDGGAMSDGGVVGGDAGSDAGLDAGVSSEAPCTFNDDCPSHERCECDEDTGCACLIGPRGTGRVGVDECEDGNDCETSLCLEGPGGTYYCSGPCSTEAECAGQLPVCADIALIGRICIREAP